MTVRTKVIGRQPTDHGPYVSGQSYGKKYQVELYGCVWESKHDNNNTAPATLDTATGTITPNTTDWKKVIGSYMQWLIDNDYQKLDASNVKDGNQTQHEVNAALAQSIDTEAARALAAEQGLQDDYDDLYALYQTLEGGSIIPVAAADWPVSNPQQNVIYRVTNSATPTAYSDYMYNGTNTILLANFTFPGIDSEPTPGSTNLVTSGGIVNYLYNNGLKNILSIVASEITPNNILLQPDGTTISSNGYNTTEFLPVDDFTEFEAYGLFLGYSGAGSGYAVYDENLQLLGVGGSPSTEDLTIPLTKVRTLYASAAYIRFCLVCTITGAYLKVYNNLNTAVERLEKEVEEIIHPLDKEYTVIVVKANGTIGTDCDYVDIESALNSITDNSIIKQYIIYIKNGTYDITGINYLGFKNYVTVRGESIDGVVIRNSTQTSDQNVVCFDPDRYGNNIIDYAAIENMTLRIYGGKCCVHIDGTSIKSGGKILIKDVHFINENPDSVQGRGGVNCGLNGGQTVEIENCYGNVLAYAHSRINPSVAAAPNYFIIKGCHLNYIGYYDLNDKVENGKHNHFIVNSCVCDYIGIGVGYQAIDRTYNTVVNEIGNDNKFNWVYIYGQGSIVGYDSWFTKYPVCSSIHRVAENHTGNTITKGTFVSVVRSQYNGIPSAANAQPVYRYNIVPYSGGELFGVAMEDIADGGNGIIQVDGKILIANNNYTAGQYITLNENGVPAVGTKENAIGIVTDANQQYIGTMVLLRKRDYDYVL